MGLFQEMGPCEVVEVAKDHLGTEARAWGWDRSSNILFVDQPDQVGFSYDTTTNVSLDLFTELVSDPPTKVPQGHAPSSFLNRTFSSGSVIQTTNTT